MKKPKLGWKKLIELFRNFKFTDYFFLVLTITGVNALALLQLLIPQQQLPRFLILLLILTSIFLVAVILAFVSGRESSPFLFDEKSQEEADFFEKWYSQPGHLTIFCTDLDWLEDAKYDGVKKALQNKEKKLRLYLRNYDNKFVDTLVKIYGAELHKVRPNIRSQHRFSVLQDEGDWSIIIRNKDNPEPGQAEKIRIEEYHSNYALVNVALDMLDDCEIKETAMPIGRLKRRRKKD
jgi:hypothetical protein